MQPEVQRGLATIAASLAVGLAAYLSIAGGYPSLSSPCSFAVVLPGLYLSSWFDGAEPLWVGMLGQFLAFAVPMPLTTYIWLAGIRKGRSRVPLRSWVLFGFLVLAVPSYFAFSWKWGLEYQGAHTTVGLAVFNGIALLVLGALAWLSARRPSWRASCVFQTGLFLFTAWSAFPWLGETL